MAGVSHFQWGIQLVLFLSPLRCNYEELFKKQKEKNYSWSKCSDDGTKLGTYKEVKYNVDTLQFCVWYCMYLYVRMYFCFTQHIK